MLLLHLVHSQKLRGQHQLLLVLLVLLLHHLQGL
jgi:hypothetical protein